MKERLGCWPTPTRAPSIGKSAREDRSQEFPPLAKQFQDFQDFQTKLGGAARAEGALLRFAVTQIVHRWTMQRPSR